MEYLLLFFVLRDEKEDKMKRLVLLYLATFILLWLHMQKLYGATVEEGDESLSPYFLVEGDPAVDQFPLLKTEAVVNIAGITSEVELHQVYKNSGKKTIEALYVFPLGTKSAIHAMTMKIGDRIIEADIEETMKAQKIYEQAQENGQIASLLEQERPNVFQMKVANIMPGDVIEVVVKYTEILVPEDGTYEFVFPTVVGPRFTGESDEATLKNEDNWVSTPYLHEGKDSPYAFDIAVNLKTGIPLSKTWVTSHRVDITKVGKDGARVTLDRSELNGGNRDYILKYTLQGNAIHSGLLLYEGEEENYFLLMVEPPDKIKMNMVPPREYVFIVDVSGSMNGFPLEVSKALIKNIVNGLREKDYFNILFFAGNSAVLSEKPLQATEKNKKYGIDQVMSQSGGGGTRILDAFQRALALPKKKGLSRIIVAITDGYVSVEKQTFDLVRENLNEANFFAFGIGSGVNRYLIEGIARAGRGEPYVVTNQSEAEKTAEKFMTYIQHPVLTDIDVEYEGFDAYDVEPLSLPDLFARRPLVLFGKYNNASGTIHIAGRTPSGAYKKSIKVSQSLADEKNAALRYLWARERIARLSDYGSVGEDVKDEVTALGLKYRLMTEYTSFVAVDKIIRKTGEVVTVKQPLPLPQGVSDYAVGGSGVNRKIKTSYYAPAPAACEELSTGDLLVEGETEPQIFVSGGTTPVGLSLDDVEDAILQQLTEELEKLFGDCDVQYVTVRLDVENGSVVSATIRKYDAKKMNTVELLTIFKKLKLPHDVKGTIEVTVEFS
jgi:Ca-activated chloride channel family protein